MRALRPPQPPDQSLLLGEDSHGIASVCLLAEQRDASVIKIQAIAIAVRLRGEGGTHADEALDVALEAAAERGQRSGCGTVTVVGWVQPRNTPAREMNRRAGFTCLGYTPGGLEEWALTINLRDSNEKVTVLPDLDNRRRAVGPPLHSLGFSARTPAASGAPPAAATAFAPPAIIQAVPSDCDTPTRIRTDPGAPRSAHHR